MDRGIVMIADWATWLGIAVCLSQSAMFSGLNLGMLGPSRLRLQVAARGGDRGAQRILDLREDFHLLLTTILWGNVAVNTLLALLADSVLTGVAAFTVSTVGITLFGEIFPQAVVSRHAFAVGGALAPLIRLYRLILLPVAWPAARLLDRLVGSEGLGLFREDDLREMLKLHIRDDSSDVSHVEGHGALNFLALDDRRLDQEAEALDPHSILSLPIHAGRAQFPAFEASPSDPFLRSIQQSRRKWIVITDEQDQPRLVLNANTFLRAVLTDPAPVEPAAFCHEPVVVTDPGTRLETVLGKLQLRPRQPGRKPLHPDLVLLWTDDERRVLTGVDLLEYLLRGIATAEDPARSGADAKRSLTRQG
jgi:CBS domain containing-hemolysin-like protein